jgi:acetolactate synthase-1/2/3 large subunit
MVSCENPLFLGTAALSDGDVLHRVVEIADLIINIGHDVVEKPPFFMHKGGTQVIHINFNSAQVDEVSCKPNFIHAIV